MSYFKRKILTASTCAARVVLAVILGTALVSGFFVPATANAAVMVTPATGGSATAADTTSAAGGSNTSTALGTITIAENVPGDFQFTASTAVTFVLNAPSGFAFDTSSSPNVSFTASQDISSASVTSFTATSLTITVTPTGGNVTNGSDTIIIGSVTPIKIIPTTGMAGTTGNITNSGTLLITGVTQGSTNFGTLTEIAGTPTAGNSTFTCSPSLQAVSGISTCNLTIKDQFNNPVQNASVQLTSSGTGNTFSTNPILTNVNGQGTVTLSSSVAQTKTVTATINGSIVLPTQAVTFYVSTPTGAAIAATPSTQEASLSGSDVSLAVTITD